jgi:hypothetical protein
MTISRSSAGVARTAAPDWGNLRAAVTGRLITRDESDWSAACLAWMVNVAQEPAAVLEVASVEDVLIAVRWAIDHGLAVTAQPVGHAARRAIDGALLLRTGALGGIELDLDGRTARVGAGVRCGELLAALDGTGLTALVGGSPDPTVVGLTLGGGISWFGRAYGLGANSVVALDVVDAAGHLVHVTATSDPNLFWALRGGGGDFGIVVSIEIALHPAAALYGGRLLWSVEHAGIVLRVFRDLAAYAPREMSIWAHIYHFPPLPEVPESVRGRSFVSIAATYLGEMITAEALLWPLREAAPVEIDTMAVLPMSQLARVTDEPVEPMPVLEHSMLLEVLDDAAIDRLVAVAADPRRSPLAFVQIRGLGGAFAEPHPWRGAAGHIAEPFLLFALGVPSEPELVVPIQCAFASLDDAILEQRSFRRLPNFIGQGQDEASGYDFATLERLRAIKRERDPLATIRSNRPVSAPVG